MECVGGEEVHCNTHCLALQRLRGDGLRGDAGCDGSAVRWVAVLWEREEIGLNLTKEGTYKSQLFQFR